MVLYCRHCRKLIFRDMRRRDNKRQMTARGYKSICESTGKMAYLRPPTSDEYIESLVVVLSN